MSGNRRIQSWTWLPLAAVLALVSVGCAETNSAGSAPEAGAGGMNGDASFEGAGGAGAEGGAGEPVRFDGTLGVTDNPVDQLFANPQRNPWDALGSDAEAAATYSDAAQTCYASVDACGGAECEAFASCCVNTGACCAPIVVDPPLPGLLDFQKCAGQTAEGCAEGVGSSAVTFGELEPVLSGRGLVPNGTATAEGGAVIGDLLNLSSQRVEVDVRFTLPVGCAGTCLESAGVAFTGSAPDAFVDAEVGLLLSGSREVVSLMIGNAVADSFDAGTDSTQWRLSLSPEGAAQVFRDGNLQGAYSFDAAALNQAQFVVFGRNLGAATTSAAIAAIGVEVSSCDNPQAWTERRPASITLDGNEVPGHASGSGPSLVDQGVRKRMAYEVDGEIFVSEQEAPGEFFLSDSIPALMPTEPYEAGGVGDPELVWDGNFLFLFYTAWDDNGLGSIGAALSVQDLPVFTKADGPTLVPTGDDVVSYDAPSVVYRDGLWLLVVRATLSDGATELRAFYTSDIDTGWERVVSGALEPLTHVDDPTSEVTDPSLIVHNSAYHLYYARRTGTRWSVELAVSDELVLWRSMGEVLGGSGEGFDSLGARSLDALSQPDRIDIVYSGQDGVSFQLGTASRAAPSDTAPSFF
ncbi:MAG: hypothetical protein JRG67_10460 [Deltaproteobacteria bacterium]|nr:hypothetical protein [Deltaproteobacteria bacterium]MBW1876237.1 hypothetical protein [Deltaproteobacteria bacterium]MBW2211450.1 hypothetical protein [Deltaproteobacteria bacterium]MBW2380013.1 hypothetical protein [Deltaproteobacteria bacterium]MBW2627596.1 hypothetical protein [Deltaproteobacteria bacterium]